MLVGAPCSTLLFSRRRVAAGRLALSSPINTGVEVQLLLLSLLTQSLLFVGFVVGVIGVSAVDPVLAPVLCFPFPFSLVPPPCLRREREQARPSGSAFKINGQSCGSWYRVVSKTLRVFRCRRRTSSQSRYRPLLSQNTKHATTRNNRSSHSPKEGSMF